jgi:hypothetical protein
MDHVVVMSFLVGLILVGLSMLKAGFVTIFISNTVIRAFTTGAAIGVCVWACLTADRENGIVCGVRMEPRGMWIYWPSRAPGITCAGSKSRRGVIGRRSGPMGFCSSEKHKG